MKLLERYKTWTSKNNSKYYDYKDEFAPHFKWNPFDYGNYWSPEWVLRMVSGLQGLRYAFDMWTDWIRDLPYYYKLPDAFWYELNDGWMEINEMYRVNKTILPPQDYDELVKRLNQPPDPAAVERLKELMSKKAPWEE